MVKTSEVFVAGGQPTITYNPRPSLNLDAELKRYLETRHKVMSISGPTKSGKTVLVRRIVPKLKVGETPRPETGVWISGGHVDSMERFWENVLLQVQGFTTVEVGKERATGASTEIRGDGGINLGVWQAGGGATRVTADEVVDVTRKARNVGPATAALEALQGMRRPLVIDDFHYIARELQPQIVRALKEPVFDGLAVILIAVPHRAFDVVRGEREMTGRVAQLQVPMWKTEELLQIANAGFKALNVQASDSIVDVLAKESFQSPHLMQDFLGNLCYSNGVESTQVGEPKSLTAPPIWEAFFRDRAQETSKPQFERLKIGPKERTDRNQRKLRNGNYCDIYEAVLLAIAHTGPPQELAHRDLMNSLKEVLEEDVPEGHEVTRVLEKMSEIAREVPEGSDQIPEPVVDFDKQLRKLHISDPFFAYYLRWGTDLDTAGKPAGMKADA